MLYGVLRINHNLLAVTPGSKNIEIAPSVEHLGIEVLALCKGTPLGHVLNIVARVQPSIDVVAGTLLSC